MATKFEDCNHQMIFAPTVVIQDGVPVLKKTKMTSSHSVTKSASEQS